MNGLRSLSLDNYEYSNNDILHPADSKDENFQSVSLRTTSDETDEAVIGTLSSNVSVSSFMKMDPLIWIPPEPANIEDDTDGIAYNDEDDEDDYNDGTKWQNSTLLNDFDKQNGNSYKEARQKAMVAAMNGQFKILVNRFLASEGLTSSNEGDDVGWLDIVTFLSWESALLLSLMQKREGQWILDHT
ncbi:hypothetical protein HPP92_005351 [Vanilla planifolia]|uniref:Uncharacterized protein n=1 Tax=Vanilla planifolia TaxID=51239 RepID=A0A835RZD0_VANPL|nr:hypothetical protein HPP92_005351 [Vanilla planifolia]